MASRYDVHKIDKIKRLFSCILIQIVIQIDFSTYD